MWMYVRDDNTTFELNSFGWAVSSSYSLRFAELVRYVRSSKLAHPLCDYFVNPNPPERIS